MRLLFVPQKQVLKGDDVRSVFCSFLRSSLAASEASEEEREKKTYLVLFRNAAHNTKPV